MKAYVDSDVILDVLLGRKEFLAESGQVLDRCEMRELEGCTTALALANIYYVLRRYNAANAIRAIRMLREIFSVLPVSDQEIGDALDSGFKDFEDAVQSFTAVHHGCELIITRNKKDFAYSALKVLMPGEYLLQARS